MTVLIFRYSRLDLSLVQLTNIFMSDLNLPRCSDSSFIRVGQDTARQLPHVFDVVATIRQRSLRRYFWAALCFFFFFFLEGTTAFLIPQPSHPELPDTVIRGRAPASVCPRHSSPGTCHLSPRLQYPRGGLRGDVFARVGHELDGS